MRVLAEIEEIARGFSGRLGVWACRVDGGEPVAYGAEEPFPTASTIKVPILYEVFRQAGEGRFRLEDPLPLTRENQVPGSGVLKDLTPGIALPVRDYCTLMITVSDNTATNVLLDLVGVEAVTRSMAAIGLHRTRLYRKIFQGSGPLAESTPADLGRLLLGLARGEWLTPGACAEMLGMLYRQQHKEMLTRYIDDYQFEEEEMGRCPVRVASKSGWSDDVRADVGLIETPSVRYVVAIMSKGCRDEREHPDHEGAIALARVSRAIYDHFTTLAGPTPRR